MWLYAVQLTIILFLFVLLQKVKEFLDMLLLRRSDVNIIPYSTAVKFLLARKLDVKRAVDLYISHQVTVNFMYLNLTFNF